MEHFSEDKRTVEEEARDSLFYALELLTDRNQQRSDRDKAGNDSRRNEPTSFSASERNEDKKEREPSLTGEMKTGSSSALLSSSKDIVFGLFGSNAFSMAVVAASWLFLAGILLFFFSRLR